jgi:hypothetical protein
VALHEEIEALMRHVARLAEIDALVAGIEADELRRDGLGVARAGAPGGRAAEEGDRAGGRAGGPKGGAQAVLVEVDRLAAERQPAPAVEGLVLRIEPIVFCEVGARPRQVAVVRQSVGRLVRSGLDPVERPDGEDRTAVGQDKKAAQNSKN